LHCMCSLLFAKCGPKSLAGASLRLKVWCARAAPQETLSYPSGLTSSTIFSVTFLKEHL
jgi:hypothetical protein